MYSEKTTLQKIEDLRHQLAETVHTKGYTNNETIAVSQKLDGLLNFYNNMIKSKTSKVD